METPSFDDKEFTRLYNEEGEDIVLNQLERDQRYLENLQITEKVLQAYYKWGLADEMPLGEALGFFDAEIEAESPRMSKDEIKQAKEFLLDLIPDTYSNMTELHEVMDNFAKEEKELTH